jgi:hypothetical protein
MNSRDEATDGQNLASRRDRSWEARSIWLENSYQEVARIIKGNSERELSREFPGLKRRLWGGEIWEDGRHVH